MKKIKIDWNKLRYYTKWNSKPFLFFYFLFVIQLGILIGSDVIVAMGFAIMFCLWLHEKIYLKEHIVLKVYK